jgi:hypothetical protein
MVALIPEVSPPHLEAAAAENANLEHVDFGADKTREVAMIDLEIMLPFPDAGAFAMALEIIP